MKERGPELLTRLRANVVTLRAHLGAAARPHLNQVELGVAVLQRRYAELCEFLKEDVERPVEAQRPEDIHETLRVVYARNWLPLVALAVVTCLILLYLVFGKIPITSKGNAMFLTRGTVVPLQSIAMGQLDTWHVSVGDFVEKGQLLATLGQPLRSKILEQQQDRLEELSGS